MNSSLDTWNFILNRLENGEDVILLVVAESSGSSPGRPGFIMAVARNGMNGSIGGGVMEVSLVERAKELLATDKMPVIEPVRQVHRKEASDASGMICSGEQTVILRRLSVEDIDTVQDCVHALEKGTDDELALSPSNFEIRPAEDDPFVRFEKDTDGKYLYSQRLRSRNELIIIGGGHCALALSELMAKLDFRITLFDDRPELNTVGKNKFAHEIRIIENYEQIAEFMKSGSERFVVVMTIGYKYDKVVVRELINKEFKYFGVLGSKAKMSVLLRELEEEGIEPARLEVIHTPIGIDINSRTPVEISVSIAAEIIAVKNRG